MKTASSALQSFLGSYAPFIGTDLYVITLVNGTTLYLTSLDRNVTYTGVIAANPDYGTNTYQSLGSTGVGTPAIQRSKLTMAIGLQPSKVDVELFAGPNVNVNGVPLLIGIAQGAWTNARVWIRRAWILPSDVPANFNTPIPSNLGGAGDGTVIWFSGKIGRIDELGPLNVKFEVRDLLYYLNRPLPKNLFGPGCYHQLFDLGCTLNSGSFQATGTFHAGCTSTVLQTGLTSDDGIPAGPVSAPTITQNTTNYVLPAVVYYAKATYVTALGETLPSPEASHSTPNNYRITVHSPPSVTGASFWNVYVGTESGDEQQQNGSPIPIGTDWLENTDGLYLTGIFPPNVATNGYWSQGVIAVTYHVGTLNGQTISAYVESSASGGVLTLRVPLPQVPTTSDTFVILPGCNKTFSTCQGKFSNLIHFSGAPFTPTPEAAA